MDTCLEVFNDALALHGHEGILSPDVAAERLAVMGRSRKRYRIDSVAILRVQEPPFKLTWRSPVADTLLQVAVDCSF